MIELKEIISNNGFALVFVVVIMTVLITVGTIIMTLSVQNSNINADISRYITCYYIAHSQILHSIDIMRTNMELIYGKYSDPDSFFYVYNNLILSEKFEPLDMETSHISSIDVSIDVENEYVSKYEIRVTTSIEEVSRTLRANIVIEWGDEISLGELFKVLSIEEV